MSVQLKLSQHAEWLSLVEVSGPFLAESILKEAFPQGLEKLDPFKKKQFRQTYDEWREIIDSHNEDDIAIKEKIHQEWINWVIKFGLEWDEDEDGDILKTGDAIPADVLLELPEHGVTLKPEFAVFANEQQKPYLLLTSFPAGTQLEEAVKGESWATTPAERMAQLCRAVGTRIGVITNGEQWLFIDAPEGGITTYASWYARLWSQEPVTLQAFFSLLNIGRIFNGFEAGKKLTELLDESLKHQDEVTETLGEQVSRAVEVLIQSLDRINHDHNGKLLEGVEPTELYEAGLTLMMRLVFLLCAEERGLFLLGDETYESNYALSTLRLKLREEAGLHGEEVLSYRKNAWSRLLAIFRAVYGGVEHENMRMPALGGSLFDPDRFPFLEGRAKGSNWKVEEAEPLPIDNRTVLLFLDAIQLYQGRTLSYRALDVEQIGYVYEGLLEKTVVRAPDVTMELNGSKSAKQPWVELKELASAELDGDAAVKKLLKERTKSSAGRINSDLDKELTDTQLDKLLAACHNDTELRDRLKPFYHFLRLDAWNNPLVYPKNAFMVTTGTDRRETGTHYTPKSLTESIVKETLEPIVYVGPAEGEPKDKWRLKSSAELLDLKICDLAMGSGAFLVQVCRWLAERVCESWLIEEKSGKVISTEGEISDNQPEEFLPVDAEERLVIAKRLIAERCLYGVDVNPLAVELAKLSIWLVTLSKGRPFGFLDHNLKHGDSLLGLHDLNQLYYLDMNPSKLSEGGGSAKQLFAQDIEQAVEEALDIRKQIRTMPIRDIHDVEMMANMEKEAEEKLVFPGLAADALIGEILANKGKQPETVSLGASLGDVFSSGELAELKVKVNKNLKTDLDLDKPVRKPFHWCLEFPEVFENRGFDSIVGNPPFIGGKKISSNFGSSYREYLVNSLSPGIKGSADFVAYFFLRGYALLNDSSNMGLISSKTIAEGETKKIGLGQILSANGVVYLAKTSIPWPGAATVFVSQVFLRKGNWNGHIYLNNMKTDYISEGLTAGQDWAIKKLKENRGLAYQGSLVLGDGFTLSNNEALEMLETQSNEDVVYRYIGSDDINTHFYQEPERWIVCYWDWDEHQAEKFEEPFQYIRKHAYLERLEKSKQKSYSKIMDIWWKYWRPRQELYEAIGRGEFFNKRKVHKQYLDKVIVVGRHTKYFSPVYLKNKYIYSDALVVFSESDLSFYAYLNSNPVQYWVMKYGSYLGQTLRVTPSDCLETLPLEPFKNDLQLNALGQALDASKERICVQRRVGITEMNNLLHSSSCVDADIQELRKIITKIDIRVLNVLGLPVSEDVHGFQEVSSLPAGDNFRYTLYEDVRNKAVNSLEMLNKELHELETGGNISSRSRTQSHEKQDSLF